MKTLRVADCPKQACVKCCDLPSCEPHREAREALRRRESLLDGTDWITRMAAQKRASRVAPGMFFDGDVRYFGETVVIWSVDEFWSNQKWREDAVRRSRNNRAAAEVGPACGDGGAGAGGGGSGGGGSRVRKRRRGGNGSGGDAEEDEGECTNAGGATGDAKAKEEKPISRRRRFSAICDELYQKSLMAK